MGTSGRGADGLTQPGGVDDRARIGAANNADWYELMFRAHGLGYRRDAGLFVGDDPPPPYHSNLTTLDPEDTDRQRAEIAWLGRRFDSFGLKDGFCRLDLEPEGFRPLFQACWVWAPPDRLAGPRPEGWERIATPAALLDWEAAWKRFGSPVDQRMFPESLLSEPAIAFYGRRNSAAFDAGCAANRSADCVGLSNIFAEPADDALYGITAGLAAGFAPGLPVVGYDQGAALEALTRQGFEAVGALRVWVSAD